MKKLVFIGAVFAVLLTSPATAADLARPVYRRPVVVAPPVYTWTGFYVGLNAGYGWSNMEVDPHVGSTFCNPIFAGGGCAPDVASAASAAAVPGVIGTNLRGGALGGQVGYSYQMGARGSLASKLILIGPISQVRTFRAALRPSLASHQLPSQRRQQQSSGYDISEQSEDGLGSC